MSDVEITITLPETLAKEAEALGMLSSKHIEMLLRADIQTQLTMMASDPEIRREIEQIAVAFEVMEADGLERVTSNAAIIYDERRRRKPRKL